MYAYKLSFKKFTCSHRHVFKSEGLMPGAKNLSVPQFLNLSDGEFLPQEVAVEVQQLNG